VRAASASLTFTRLHLISLRTELEVERDKPERTDRVSILSCCEACEADGDAGGSCAIHCSTAYQIVLCDHNSPILSTEFQEPRRCLASSRKVSSGL